MSDSLRSVFYFTTMPILGQVLKKNTHPFRRSLTLGRSLNTEVYTSTGIMAKFKDADTSIDLGRTKLL